ncbi:Calpain-type cysteine protease DEK1 [Capsicum baccatum]|uniref:Calpain-type cysteine protease DEK1 n=1 Tax=Capsicum baccatum TaxID=33114 RepID=A0A2G2V6C4_CAPBA|nr:Calpain-type cysteine protease DEK1 [Capsicum baccatum]
MPCRAQLSALEKVSAEKTKIAPQALLRGVAQVLNASSSADTGHLGNATVPCTVDGSTWNNIEGINSDKSIDSGRPSLALRSSSCRLVVQEPEILDLNLALAFQEKLSDPRITSMLKRKGRHIDRELANLLQDKGLDPNFVVMLKENGLDPMILALLQRSSLDADREHRDRTPERAWLLFSLIFILETVVVAIFRPKTIKLLNATHQQFEFGIAVLLLSPVVCSILAFLRSLQAEDLSMTSKPRKYGFIAWMLSTCVGLLLSFLSKSSVLLGLSLTVPLMVACLSIAIPIWIHNGHQFWSSRSENAGRAGNHLTLGMKEDFIVNKVRRMLYEAVSSFNGDLEDEETMSRLIKAEFAVLRDAFNLPPESDDCVRKVSQSVSYWKTWPLYSRPCSKL